MAYQVRQYTSQNSNNYIDIDNIQQVDENLIDQHNVLSGIMTNIETQTQQQMLYFTDTACEYTFEANNIYYLAADLSYSLPTGEGANNINPNRIVTLKLLNDATVTGQVEQYLEEIAVSFSSQASQQQQKIYHVEVIFKAIQNFNYIYFLLNRDLQDLIRIQTQGSDIEDDYVTVTSVKILNLSDQLSNKISDINKAIKIGMQGTPGLLMCINGEAIRIGNSGIYEIKSGYKITFLTFLKKSSQYFILDCLMDNSSSTNTSEIEDINLD